MPKVRNISGRDRVLPWLGDRLVEADAVVEVPDADPYICQESTWELVSDKKKGA